MGQCLLGSAEDRLGPSRSATLRLKVTAQSSGCRDPPQPLLKVTCRACHQGPVAVSPGCPWRPKAERMGPWSTVW